MTRAMKNQVGFDLMSRMNSIDRAKTAEDKAEEAYQLFQTDACVTVISAMSAMVTELASRLCDMVEFSARSEYRAKYNILKDYASMPHTLSAVGQIRKAISKQNSATNDVIRTLTRNTVLYNLPTTSDAGADFISRVDASDEEFAKDYAAIRQQITQMLRPFKCSDPVMLYALVNCMYMARRYGAMARYVMDFAVGFKAGEPFYSLLVLNIKHPLELLINRLGLADKAGHELHFVFYQTDYNEWQQTIAKKSWQKQHADNPPVLVNLHQLFLDDMLVRLSWQLETHMFELKTIDKLIAASEGHDPEYRKDYRQKRVQSCASTYEQAMLVQSIMNYKWAEVPRRMRDYVDSINARKCIDMRRRPKPVVSFKLVPKRDRKRQVVRNETGEVEYDAQFVGIWNSAYEAECETSVKWQKIRKSVELKAVNDGTNHVWLSLEDYISMTHSSLEAVRPEVAEEFRRLLPEFDMRTARQIAEEAKLEQGTFAQAVV